MSVKFSGLCEGRAVGVGALEMLYALGLEWVGVWVGVWLNGMYFCELSPLKPVGVPKEYECECECEWWVVVLLRDSEGAA